MRADRLRSPRLRASPQARPSSVCGQARHLPQGEGTPPWNFIHRKGANTPCKIHRSATQQLANFSKYRPLIRELVTRDLKVKYRRSVLGYMWSILNPLLMMLLQTLVFSYMFRFDIPNFPLYLICGNTLFNFFNESTNMGMGSVLGNASLIKKCTCPSSFFPSAAWCPAL